MLDELEILQSSNLTMPLKKFKFPNFRQNANCQETTEAPIYTYIYMYVGIDFEFCPLYTLYVDSF